MNLKNLFLAGAVALSALSVSAEDSAGNYLHIRTSEGWQVLNLDTVDRLTFKGGTMTATDKDNNTVASFPQESLEKMYVDETAGIGQVSASEAEATFTYDAASRTVTMLADGAFKVYNAAGALLVNIPAVEKDQTVVLTGLQAGVVLISSGDYTLKAAVK